LDAEYWTKQGIDKPQLIEMFKAEYERVKKDNPDLPQDEIEMNAQEDLKSTIASYKKGGASMGKGAVFGVSGLFDYVRIWKATQTKAYEDLVDGKKKFVVLYFKDADGKKTKKTYKTAAEMISDKVVKVVVDPKTGEKKIIALDKRGGDKRGKAYPESSNLATFIAVWVSSLTKKKYTVVATIGGEQGDSIVNPKCQSCGKDSFDKVCTNTITVVDGKGHKIKRECGAEREGYEVPNILDACGTLTSFALKMKTNDKKELIGIEWAQDQTKIIPGKKLDIKMEFERKDGKIVKNPQGQPRKIYSGELMQWIPTEWTVTTKLINDPWVKNKTMTGSEAVKFWEKYGGKAVFLIGTLFDVGKVYYGNRRGSIIDDTTSAEGDDGQPIKIPDHVFFRQMKNKIGKKSLCVFVGKLEREQNKDFKTKKYQTAKIKRKAKDGTITEEEVPVYSKPYINISCVIPIRAQITEDEMVKKSTREDFEMPDEDKKIVVKTEEISEEDAAASVKKIATSQEATKPAEETTEETVEETEETTSDDTEDAQAKVNNAGGDESDDSEPDSEDEDTEEDVDESEPETSEPPTKEDAAEAPEEVESLEAVATVEKKTKKKRDYGK
jgi:hypothetical protein